MKVEVEVALILEGDERFRYHRDEGSRVVEYEADQVSWIVGKDTATVWGVRVYVSGRKTKNGSPKTVMLSDLAEWIQAALLEAAPQPYNRPGRIAR